MGKWMSKGQQKLQEICNDLAAFIEEEFEKGKIFQNMAMNKIKGGFQRQWKVLT